MVQLECPACHARCEADPDVAGRSMACPKCGQAMVVPRDGTAITADPGVAPPAPAPLTGITTPELAEAQQAKKRADAYGLGGKPKAGQSVAKDPASAGPWLLIIGLLLGAGLLVFMTWDGLSHSKDHAKVSEHVVELTEANWEREVLDSDLPVVVDFSASWCGPCRDFAPTLDRIAERYQGKVKVGKIDYDQAQNLAKQYGIQGIPHVMIFKRGELRKELSGRQTEAVLARAIESVLK